MNKLTKSMNAFLFKKYPELYSLIRFGHFELFTDEMGAEYYAWIKTDEGKQYLKGGSKYKEATND